MQEQPSAFESSTVVENTVVKLVRVLAAALACSVVACGGPPDRPAGQQVSGTATHVVHVSQQDSASASKAPCEHGTVSECKVWITEIDCYAGVMVCDQGEFSGCMDVDAAEELLAQLNQPVG